MKSDIIQKIYEENLIDYMDRVSMVDRDKEIVKIYLSEKPTYQDLGNRYGISHERIRQILIKFAIKAHHYYNEENRLRGNVMTGKDVETKENKSQQTDTAVGNDKCEEKRNANTAYIDGQNLRFGTAKANNPWTVDLRRFRIYLKDKYNVSDAYYFIGAYDPKHQELYNDLQRYGYIVVFREHSESSVSRKKGNVDTDIVFMVMKSIIENTGFDKIILVSGDGDYWRMVDYLISKDRFEKLLAPSKKGISSLYRKRTPDIYRDYLDSESIKSKIQYVPNKKDNSNKKAGSP